jgi:hypothetical protein
MEADIDADSPHPVNGPAQALTYEHLIRPTPLRKSLADVAWLPTEKPCERCRKAVPDRSKAVNDVVRTDFEAVDRFPQFPSLKSAAKLGCGLCHLIRKTIRQQWATRPMEEWGVGPLSDRDETLEDLLNTTWDGLVRIFNLRFTFQPFPTDSVNEMRKVAQMGGIITCLSLEFGPASAPCDPDGNPLHSEISQIIGFKVYDSIGELQRIMCCQSLKVLTTSQILPHAAGSSGDYQTAPRSRRLTST